ncbi:MAG: methyltransferase domain-containing protein [Rudaea sp.]|uniref:class I SAM-dependent methyltransferase n=1 Tax=Rudaea sp. TaxID=2136325 RepID=UPI0039E2A34F
MPFDSTHSRRHAALQRLYEQELAALAPILAGVYGNAGLLLRADEAMGGRLPAHLLGTLIELTLDDARTLRGSLSCAAGELPLASESCKLVVVQHLFERLGDPAACAGEIARVLASEGVLLVLGFNPLSLWRPWLASAARRAQAELRFRSSQSCGALFAALGMDVLQTRYFGALSPWLKPDPAAGEAEREARTERWLRFRGSWLLLARKRRSALTPLRLRRDVRELARNPRLAPGAHRECASALAPIEEKCA